MAKETNINTTKKQEIFTQNPTATEEIIDTTLLSINNEMQFPQRKIRQDIFDHYWGLANLERQREFIVRHAIFIKPKYRQFIEAIPRVESHYLRAQTTREFKSGRYFP
ncbi:uncharacterized protein [Halyomorpha halys]|uniref:uncharacterized protein n=1 Tax=Halyomorpha halys TaxID=286706 RepID=UPI0034D359F7